MSASGSTVASLSGVRPVTSLSTYQQLVGASTSSGRALVLLFTAEWHPPCKQMRLVCDALANQLQTASGVAGPLFGEVDAESVSEVTELFGDAIASVPTTLVLRAGKVVDQVQGASAQELTAMVQKHARVEAGATPAPAAAATVAAAPATAAAASASAEAAAPSESKEDLDARLYKLVRASPVMAFIKGTPSAPRCGFTRKLLELLQAEQIQVGTFDILEDKVVREGLKAFSNWPTYPQLYVDGELVGGLDVVKELAASGELQAMIPAGHILGKDNAEEELNARLKKLVKQKRVMLFMKGSPDAPQCGFSSKAVALLSSVCCTDYGHFDIFTDSAVREGLKTLFNWPTFPQLYVDGELIGGLDVLQEMNENGELEEVLNAPPPLETTQ